MAILCLGGTFNPIHHGHLLTARAVAERAGFERVLLIPAAQPPHKPSLTTIAPAQDRLAMCQLAAAGDRFYDVSDIEIKRAGPSYTIETVRELKRLGWPSVAWLIGADVVANLPHWHEPAALLAETQFVLAARPGWPLDWANLPPELHPLKSSVVEAPLIEISASDLRARVAAGRSITYMTPDSVVGYIAERRLYTATVSTDVPRTSEHEPRA